MTRSNKGELAFGEIDSGIVVGTAGKTNAGSGRSFTYQNVHMSEVALWNDAQEHVLGIMEAVPDVEGTEVIQESTAQGMGNYWHLHYMAAMRGQSNFRAIFIPFYVHEEYQSDPPAGWEPPEAFREMRDAHDLSPEQLRWAWEKNDDDRDPATSEAARWALCAQARDREGDRSGRSSSQTEVWPRRVDPS